MTNDLKALRALREKGLETMAFHSICRVYENALEDAGHELNEADELDVERWKREVRSLLSTDTAVGDAREALARLVMISGMVDARQAADLGNRVLAALQPSPMPEEKP